MTAAAESQPDADATTEVDVVVVGSGAAGMAAALTAAKHDLATIVVEKSAHFGGSTARSGGGVWIPNNAALREAGIDDTIEQARSYLRHIIDGATSEERQDAFLDHGPRMLSSVLAQTPLRMRWVPNYSDYYPEAPGGRVGGRSVEPIPMDGKRILGADLDALEPDYGKVVRNFVVTQADFRWLNLLARHPRGVLRALRVGLRWIWSHATGKNLLVRGQALAAGLRAGLRDAGVPLWLGSPLVELLHDGGRITGIVIERDGAPVRITARRGVILAAGGFEWNEQMRKQYQREPIGTQWTVGARANTGDAILAAQHHGAAVELMDDAWWGPSIPLTGGPWFCLAERTLPGCIMVNGEGKRFVNEASPYIDAVHAMYGEGDGPARNMPTWLILDQRYRNRYVFAGLGPRQPLPGRWFKSGAVVSASTIGELAERIEVPAAALESTVERFNGFARTGKDLDFQRGDSAYDHYYGDPRHKRNPSLGEIGVAPYYAVRIVPGDLGTKGGLRTDVHGRVLREDGSTIDGLYAAGNCSAAVMGHTYAGPGATLGPAMTFGYLAALHMAGATDSDR